MPAASGPASDAPINRPKQEQQEQQPQQDDLGLLPVVKFLQSALAMKSKVSVCVCVCVERLYNCV